MRTLFERIPQVGDTQAAWLLLATFWLRSVNPDLTDGFAEHHDAHVWQCLQRIIGSSGSFETAKDTSSLPFLFGGLGLSGASRVRRGAHWASWADCMRMVNKKHPEVAETMLDGMVRGPEECFRVVRSCAQTLTDAGLEMPSWRLLAVDEEAVRADNPEPNEPKFGWQQKAGRALHQKFYQEVHFPRPHRARTCNDEVAIRAPCFICLHCCPHAQDDEDRPPVVQGGSAKDVLDSHCPCPHAPADVAANLILLATIAQRAPRQGFWEEGGFHLSALLLRSAARQGHE